MQRTSWYLTLLAAGALLLGAPGAAAQEAKLVEITLQKDLSIAELLDTVSRTTGRPVVYEPENQRIRGRRIGTTVQMKVPEDTVFQTFRAILAFYELILVPVGPKGYETYLVVDSRSTNNLIKNKATFVPFEKLTDYADRDGYYIATAIPVKHAENLVRLRTALSTMVSPAGIGRVHETDGQLMVMDFAPNVATMAKVVAHLDQPRAKDRRDMELVRLSHAPADDVAIVLRQLLTAPPRNPKLAGKVAPAPRIAPYPRVNGIAIYANAEERAEIRAMIATLDVAAPDGAK